MSGPLLALRGLRRAFGPERAVDGVDLDVGPGEVHALVGLNGAGKTTLMRLALGMLRPDAGQSVVGTGPAVEVGRAPDSVWADVGHLIETPFAYAELTVTETVVCAARLRGRSRAQARVSAARVIDDLALDRWAGRRVRSLSLGNRQRVGLACALVHRPRLLVLDEPANALDPAGVVLVREQLLRAAGAGVGMLVSSHHLDEVARIADRITVMHAGRIVGTLPVRGADLERQFFAMVHAADQPSASVR